MSNAALQGSLASFRLPDVLTFLNAARKTGTLTISSDQQESYVFFEDGSLIYAGSNQADFRLSAILLRKKRISRAQFDQIDDLMSREGGRFGQIAIQQGILTEEQLRDFLKVQVSEILYDCFVWTGGTFTFADEMKLPPHAVTISVDLGNLIMEGARRIEEWESCVRLLPDKSVVFRVVATPKDEKITLTVDEWKILFLINGVRSLEELCHDAEEDPFHVYRVVYGLFASKLIEAMARDNSRNDTGRTMIASRAEPAGTPDDTMRQGQAVFHADSTVQEMPDDTSLLVSADAHLSYSDVVKATVAQLKIETGDAQGTVFPLVEQEYLIGRQRDNNIQLTDLGISGFHARIFRGPDGYAIEDLKSRNGTWLNGMRVYHAVLHHGDKLRMGSTDLTYEVLYMP